MRFKAYFQVFFAILILAIMLFDIKAIAEMQHFKDKCTKCRYSTNADYKSRYSANAAYTAAIDKNGYISKLCGCIKFREHSINDKCQIARDDNRILLVSLKYSAPTFYSYSCKPSVIRYSQKECAEKAIKITSFACPDNLVGSECAEIIDYYSEGFFETVCLYFPGNKNKVITVKLRRDTCNVVYFDARQIYCE